MSETIKLLVTQERFEEVVSIEDAMNLGEMTRKEVYDYMVQFVTSESGKYLPAEEARKLFKTIPAKELSGYISKFFKAVSDAFVNPPSGAVSDEQS